MGESVSKAGELREDYEEPDISKVYITPANSHIL
jgi:hypothetical protein